MLRVSRAEPGPGLRSLVKRSRGAASRGMLAMPQAGGAGGGAVPRTCWCPASHPAYLRPSRAFGSGRPTGGRGGQLGSGSCCPLQRTALSPPQRTATPCPGFPPALLAPRLPRVGAVDRPHGLVPVLQREQPKGLSHRGVSLQPWLGSARHSLRARGGSGSGTTRWERCPGPARCPSMVMRLGWDRGVSRSCHGPLAHGCCSLTPSLSQCFIYPDP